MTIRQIDDVTFVDDGICGEQALKDYDVSFYDEDGDVCTPNAGTITWILTDYDGNEIKPEQNPASASTIAIAIQGDDTAIQTSEAGQTTVRRKITINWEYDSDRGTDRKGVAVIIFRIKNLAAVS